MAEYLGEDDLVALQNSIRARQGEIAGNPLLANGGRMVNVLDPESLGWDKVKAEVASGGAVALMMVDLQSCMAQAQREFGDQASYPYWEAFAATPDQMGSACRPLISQRSLPTGWHISSQTLPDDETIDRSQVLNQQAGVAPLPGYYLAGRDVPSMLPCLWDESGQLAACASASMRYHPEGRLVGWLLAGGVLVADRHRRKGLGALINARLLIDSHRAFGWRMVLEQARADNAASVGMIQRCGLSHLAGKATIVINAAGRYSTR